MHLRLASAVLLGIGLLGAAARADEFVTSGLPPGTASDPSRFDLATVTLTQNVSSSLVTGGSVACASASGTAENHFLRRFVLADHGIAAPFDVVRVDFGVDQVVAPGGLPLLVEVRLLRIPSGAPLTFANLEPLASAPVPLVHGTALVIVPVAVAATVDPALDDLVVDVRAPDLRGTGRRFFIGANPFGQSRPAYLAAPSCGAGEPVETAAIGAPDMHTFITVTGSERPTATASITWGRLKTLYR